MMIDQGTLPELPATVPMQGNDAAGAVLDPSQPLEERLRRLEDAVADLQDTRKLEERVVERVADRVTREQPSPGPSTAIFEAGRRLLPAAVSMMAGTPAPVSPPSPVLTGGGRQSWILLDAYLEIKTMVWMFLDSRYRVSWSARLVPIIAVGFMVLSWLFLSGIWLLGPLIDRLFDVLLAYIAYKVLSREAQHYREALLHIQAHSGS